jgi:hypothetical protein
MQITYFHPRATLAHWGEIPNWLSDASPKPAKQQLHDGYRFGGWQSMKSDKIKMQPDGKYKYPGDPMQFPISEIRMASGERVLLYDSSIVVVVEKDGNWDMARMD